MEHQQQGTIDHPLNARFAPEPRPPSEGYTAGPTRTMDTRQAVAVGLIVLGMIGVIVAWFGISGTLDPGEQMPYLASGGIGGAALIAIGVMMYVSWEHVQDRAALTTLLHRLGAVETALREVVPAEPDPVAKATSSRPTNGRSRRKTLRAEPADEIPS